MQHRCLFACCGCCCCAPRRLHNLGSRSDNRANRTSSSDDEEERDRSSSDEIYGGGGSGGSPPSQTPCREFCRWLSVALSWDGLEGERSGSSRVADGELRGAGDLFGRREVSAGEAGGRGGDANSSSRQSGGRTVSTDDVKPLLVSPLGSELAAPSLCSSVTKAAHSMVSSRMLDKLPRHSERKQL